MKLTKKLISMLLVLVMLVGLVPAVFAEQAQVSTAQPVAEAGGAKQAKSAPAAPAAPAVQPEGELAPEEDGDINGQTKFVFDFSGVMPDKVVYVPYYSKLPSPPNEPLIEAWYENKEFKGNPVNFEDRLRNDWGEFRIYAKWKMQYVLHYPDHIERQNWRLQKPKDDPNITGWYLDSNFKTLVNWNTVGTIRQAEIHLYARAKKPQNVRFIDYDKDGNKLPQPGEKQAIPVSLYPEPITLSDKDLTGGWFVVSENFAANGRITVEGNVSLILQDGCTLDARNGIFVRPGSSLTIYAQSEGKNAGALQAHGRDFNAGIGGISGVRGYGAITINGGWIQANADGFNQGMRGIGVGFFGGGGTVTINAGTVRSSGIGGGGSSVYIRNNPLIRAGGWTAMREVRSTDYVRELNQVNVLVTDRKDVTIHTVKAEADMDILISDEHVEDGGKLDMLRYETDTDYVIDWYKDKELTQRWDVGRDTVTKDMTLYAKCDRKYVVKFDMGGIGATPEDMYVRNGARIPGFKTPDTEDYHFLGWYTNSRRLGRAWDFGRDSVRSDMTLYAKWEKKCVVTFEANGYGLAPNPLKVIFGSRIDEIKLKDTEDMHFLGWYRNESGRGTPWDFRRDTVTHDITLYAKWEEKCTVTFDANGYGVAPNPVKVVFGSKLEPVEPTDPENGRFLGWYRDKDCRGRAWDFRRDVVTEDMTLYAKWEERLTVTFDANGCGVAPDPMYVPYGAKLQEVKPEDTKDMHFVSWHRDQACLSNAWNFGMDIVQEDLTLYAKWEKKTTPTPVPHYGPIASTPEIVPAPAFKLILTIGQKLADLNGKSVENDVAPVIRENRTMLPIAFIVKALGGTIDWNAETRTVTITLGDKKLALTIGSKTMMENGKEVAMDVAPFISENRTYLPLAAVADALDAEAAWDEIARTVTVTK